MQEVDSPWKKQEFNRDINWKGVFTGSKYVLTAIGPSILSMGTIGKTTDPSGIAYTSTSKQSILLR